MALSKTIMMLHLRIFIFTCFIVGLFSCQTSPQIREGCQCDCEQMLDPNLPDGSFRFVVTGDPQYNYEDMNPDKASVLNADQISERFAQKICCEQYKGAVISGDLTHYARLDEFERYQNFIRCFSPYAFDGLGNHDFSWSDETAADSSDFAEHGLEEIIEVEAAKWSPACLTIWDDVRTRKRIPEVNHSYPNVHYSWDWEGIHFVQLNLSPAEAPVKYKVAQNPFKALSFLKADLAKHVGQSGRPIILAHHYGFDIFSMGVSEDGSINPKGEWWTAEDRRKYWEVLQPYNVIAIFSGHAHYCKTCYLPWDGENIGEDNVTPPFIPTFVAGAAREGKYLDCEINQDSLIVSRFNHDQPLFRKAFAIDRGKEND
ncbi:MAG: metallophosphoesterase [Bacteroidota bacterium]